MRNGNRTGRRARAVPGALLGTFLFGLITSPVSAHHSYAGFDRSRSKTLTGTVVKVDWKNPHVHFWITVPSPQTPEGYEAWAFEAGSINLVTRFGWTKDTFHVGEQVAVTFFPMIDGRHGGAFIKARHADGSWTTGDLAGANYFSR